MHFSQVLSARPIHHRLCQEDGGALVFMRKRRALCPYFGIRAPNENVVVNCVLPCTNKDARKGTATCLAAQCTMHGLSTAPLFNQSGELVFRARDICLQRSDSVYQTNKHFTPVKPPVSIAKRSRVEKGAMLCHAALRAGREMSRETDIGLAALGYSELPERLAQITTAP